VTTPSMTQSISLAASPKIAHWLAFPDRHSVIAQTGKVELGQGIRLALRQIVADELGFNLSQVHLASTTIVASPNESFTAGSMSIEHSGNALRAACIAIRELAARGNVDDYSQLDLDVDIAEVTTTISVSAAPVIYVGESIPRDDFAGKAIGAASFLQDLRFDGQLFARVVRPPQRGCELTSIDIDSVEHLPGVVSVHRDRSFLAVIASSEWAAINAREQLTKSAQWSTGSFTTNSSDMERLLRTSACIPDVLASSELAVDESHSIEISQTYTRPYIAHASIGTSCAIAQFDGNNLSIWTHSQGIFPLRADIATALSMSPDQIFIEHVPAAGCYGHNPADDVAFEAALLAIAHPGNPLALTWSREDELAWDPFGPAAVVDISASATSDGKILNWKYDSWSNGHSTRPTTLATPAFWAEELLGHGQLPPASDPPVPTGGGIGRNAIPFYEIPAVNVQTNRALEVPVRTSAMRALGAHINVFATESHIDELAAACNLDPIEFRLRNLSDQRAIDVLQRVSSMSNWSEYTASDTSALGVAVARYKNKGAWCATVAELEVTDSVTVRNLWIAVDVGRVINPDGVLNQIQGGAIQSLSWTLREQIQIADGLVTSDNWEDYPIARFTDIPPVHVEIIDRPLEQSLGSGETSIGPTAAALGNALARTLGVRVVNLPLNSKNILRTIS